MKAPWRRCSSCQGVFHPLIYRTTKEQKWLRCPSCINNTPPKQAAHYKKLQELNARRLEDQ